MEADMRAGGETPTAAEADDALLVAMRTLEVRGGRFEWHHANVLRRLRSALPSLLARHRDGERLDALESWTKGDQTICPPGNHGGENTHWLLARDDDAKGDRYGIWSETTEGATLRDAIDLAMSAGPSPERAP